MRSRLEDEMKELEELLLKMGAIVEKNIELSMRSLLTKDLKLAQSIIEQDKMVDRLENDIETKAVIMLATQSPLASDLRKVSSILKIITDLERMGDNAANIAKVTLEIGTTPLVKPLVDIPVMAEIARKMVKNSLDSFVNLDKTLAIETAKEDDLVDDLYKKIYTELLTMVNEDKNVMGQVINLLLVGRFLERIADHSTNVCERVIYMLTGERVSF